MIINDIEIDFEGVEDFTREEAINYINYVSERVRRPLKSISIKGCSDGSVDINYVTYEEKFERIRRITGYLAGSIDRWNNSKKYEERDRVKHMLA